MKKLLLAFRRLAKYPGVEMASVPATEPDAVAALAALTQQTEVLERLRMEVLQDPRAVEAYVILDGVAPSEAPPGQLAWAGVVKVDSVGYRDGYFIFFHCHDLGYDLTLLRADARAKLEDYMRQRRDWDEEREL